MLQDAVEVIEGRHGLMAGGSRTAAPRDGSESQLLHDVLLIHSCKLQGYPGHTLLHVLLSGGELAQVLRLDAVDGYVGFSLRRKANLYHVEDFVPPISFKPNVAY